MLREDFENHALWEQIAVGLQTVAKIEGTASAEEIPALRRVRFLLTHVRSYSELGFFSELFNEPLMLPVSTTVTQLLTHLNQRAVGSAYRSYTDSALSLAETLLVNSAPWPRPYAKGAQVKQMTTLFQDLLSVQAEQISFLESKYRDTAADVDILLNRMYERKDEVLAELETFKAEGQEVLKSVNDQKTRIDDVIQKGLERVNALQDQNTAAFEQWTEGNQKKWDSYVTETKKGMDRTVAAAGASLARIEEEEKEYANISSHLAGSKLADEFANEAVAAQRLGLGLYAIGFAVLAASAAPLLFLMMWPPATQDLSGQWQHFLIRVSLGIIGASAATVLIRLGSRFVTGATASKRMALELKTFGPFLANVKDKGTVDGARLELVDRAFGKSYVPNNNSETHEEAVPVSAFAHILELVKAMK